MQSSENLLHQGLGLLIVAIQQRTADEALAPGIMSDGGLVHITGDVLRVSE
jgi:hypothetical protein